MLLKNAHNYFINLLNLNDINKQLEIRILLKYYCNLNDTNYITQYNSYILSKNQITQIKLAIKKRNSGYPMAYILKYKYFWKNKFIVNKNVLIPRPETELLIEATLSIFKDKNTHLKILDIGTGSGCIILSLLKEYKNAIGIATDISKKALDVASINAKKLKLSQQRLFLIQQNLISSLKADNSYDIIVSNPPYINNISDNNLCNYVKLFEPHVALFANNNGLFFYEEILKNARYFLKNNGYIFLEIGINQSKDILNIASNNFLGLVKIIKDLNNINRIIIFKYSKNLT